MTRTIAKFVAPAALVLVSFAAQAGEGPIQVGTTRAASVPATAPAPATSSVQVPVKQTPATSNIYVG